MTMRGTILIGLVLAVCAAGIWAYAAFRRDISASRARLVGISKIVATKSGPIEYAEAGSGPIVLVVHGAGGGFDQGLELAEPLVRHGFRVIAMSRFGYLRTPMPADASVAAQSDAHANLLDALAIEKAAIFGISAGGPSALQFAISHPEKCTALVMMVPLAYKPPETAASAPRLSPFTEKMLMTIVGSDFAFWLGTKLTPNLVAKTVLGTPPGIIAVANSDERLRVSQFTSHILPISRRVQGIIADSAISASLTRLNLESVRVPSLLISARDDLYGTFASTQYTANGIPGAKFIGYDSGGHMLVGHNDEVDAAISSFLKTPNDQTMAKPTTQN